MHNKQQKPKITFPEWEKFILQRDGVEVIKEIKHRYHIANKQKNKT